MTPTNIKILFELNFPSQTVRLCDCAGPYMDMEGNVWRGAGELSEQALSGLQYAFSGEAVSMDVTLCGMTHETADLAYSETQRGDVIGALCRVMIQDCDDYDQPVGAPKVQFTGKLTNIKFDESVSDDGALFQLTVTIANRMTLRRLTSGSVLSDVDQKALSKRNNPNENPDRFCERVPLLIDKTINWPRY